MMMDKQLKWMFTNKKGKRKKESFGEKKLWRLRSNEILSLQPSFGSFILGTEAGHTLVAALQVIFDFRPAHWASSPSEKMEREEKMALHGGWRCMTWGTRTQFSFWCELEKCLLRVTWAFVSVQNQIRGTIGQSPRDSGPLQEVGQPVS